MRKATRGLKLLRLYYVNRIIACSKTTSWVAASQVYHAYISENYISDV